MATWKKVIVSGSNAHLASVTASAGVNVSTNQQITTSPSTTFLSGSFSGSFNGNGSGLTNITLSNNLTQGTGITSFTYNGGSAQTVAVSGASALSTNNITKWTGAAFANSSLTDNGTAITGTTSIQLTGANSSLSGSFSGSFFGNGSGLSGISATFPVTALTPIISTTQVFVNDGTNKYATVSQFNSSSYAGVSGDISIDPSTGVATIQANSVALGIDTSGSYVANVANGTGISAIAAASEGAAVTVSVSGAAALTANTVTKWTGAAFSNSLITDNGTTVTVGGNLTVTGTASFQETTNLAVADRFILLASGSNSNGEGGIVIQQATNGIGELFGWDNDTTRWAVTSSFVSTNTSFVPDAFVSLVTTAAGTTPAPAARYNAVGNIYVSSGDESIWIYS